MAACPRTSSGLVGLLDPHRVELREGLHPLDRLRHIPHLVGVDHQGGVGSDDLTRDREPADVFVEVGADLQLDVAVAGIHRLLAQPPQFLVGVAQPPGARRVAGVAADREFGDALFPRRGEFGQDRDRLVAGEGVGEVTQVGGIHQLLGGHVGQQPPERDAGGAGGEIPHRVHHGGEREVDDALLGSEPAQLGVALQPAVRGSEVADDLGHVSSDQREGALPGRLDAQIVAAADREREPETREGRVVGHDVHVGGGVVAVFVHRVRPVHAERGRETDVGHGNRRDRGHARSAPVLPRSRGSASMRPGAGTEAC